MEQSIEMEKENNEEDKKDQEKEKDNYKEENPNMENSEKNFIVEENNNNNNIINNMPENNILAENSNQIDNNINRTNINNSIEEPEIEESPEIFNPKITFSFAFFFILNTLCFIHSFFTSFELKNYSLCLWPIINKRQYYRLIVSHFYHYGIFDYLIAMTGLFFITKYLEREIGSIYTIIIALHGIIIVSFFYLLSMWIFKSLFRLIEYNFVYQYGFSSIDFCLYMSYYLLKKNYHANINFSFIDIRGIHSVYILILIFQLITPSASLILNVCGTLSAIIVFKLLKYFSLPRNEWVSETEKFLRLENKNGNSVKKFLCYFSSNENDNIINNLKELDYFCKASFRNFRIFNNSI